MSRDLNSVVIIGRLTRDVELKYTPGGVSVCKFSVACNDSYTKDGQKKESVNFFDITVWNKQAENCSKYLKKGSQICIHGKLKNNRWVDNSTGKQVSKIEIEAISIQFLNTVKNTIEGQFVDESFQDNPWNEEGK